jgi:predicted kinase
MSTATLHLVCGKAGAGKSTLCARLAASPGTIVIAQHPWMAALYPEELRTLADYIRLVPRLRAAMGPHVSEVLRAGISVVLDWPANTVVTRAWMRGIFEAAGAAHTLHWLDVPDAVCLARIAARNAGGAHEFTLSEAEFRELTRYFEPPSPAEGFNLCVHAPD